MATCSEMETELAPTSQLKVSGLSLTFCKVLSLIRQSLFPLKPWSLKLTEVQPPESPSLTGCGRCYQWSQRSDPLCTSEEVWLRSWQFSLDVEEEVTTSISRGSPTLGHSWSHISASVALAGQGRGGRSDGAWGGVTTDWAGLSNPTPFLFCSVSPLAVSLPPPCFPHPKITSSAVSSARRGGTVLWSWSRFVHTENHSSPNHSLFYFSRDIFNPNGTREDEMTRHDGVAAAKSMKCSSSSYPCLSLFPFSLLGEVPIISLCSFWGSCCNFSGYCVGPS